MGVRVRPATTLVVIIAIALAFQVLTIVSVPVTQNIWLCKYGRLRFGVFGLCSETGCSPVGIGYSVASISDLDVFSLPSNARHSVSKLLIVHPIAAGFTLVLLFLSLALHWHGPSSSMRFSFLVLLWSLPSFFLTLLSFLVDLLLFVPHLAWAGWLMLASTILIALCSILLCIQRRTISSRKSAAKYNNLTSGNGFQLAPLSYGFGTIDGGSVNQSSHLKQAGDDDSDERPLFGNTTFDDSLAHNRTHDDLNDLPQAEIYDSLRGNAQSASTYRSNDILAPLETAYKGGYEPQGYVQENPQPLVGPSAAPYPQGISSMNFEDLPDVRSSSNAPYPLDDTFANSSPTRLTGPRPMPMSPARTSTAESSVLPSEMNSKMYPEDDVWKFVNSAEEPSVPQIPQLMEHDNNNGAVERRPTYRTSIAQKLDALQPKGIYSTDSFGPTSEDLLEEGRNKEMSDEDEDDSHLASDSLESEAEQDALMLNIPDSSSSTYSSRLPSTTITPTATSFPHRELSLLQRSRIPDQSSSQPQTNPHQNPMIQALSSIEPGEILSPSDFSIDHFPLPDPHDRRTTPPPSFSNESIGSSTFTSVSQRGINPEYLKHHPEEARELHLQHLAQRKHIQRQNLRGGTDLLIDSNPDFSIGGNRKKSRP